MLYEVITHRPRGESQGEADQRRQDEDHLVGAVGDDDLLQDELEEVGEGLQQPEGTDDVRTLAHLHAGPDLPVGQQ